MHTTIILAGGSHSADFGYNAQMLPIRGKPVLHWVVSPVYGQETNESHTIVVLAKGNEAAKTYLDRHFPKVRCVFVDERERDIKIQTPLSILTSLLCGLDKLPLEAERVTVLLGDTICHCDTAEIKENFILTSDDFISSSRWCLVERDKDGYIKKIYDKHENISLDGKSAVVGYYHFNDIPCLKKNLKALLREGKKEISDLLAAYGEEKKIKCVHSPHWIDLGHKVGIIKNQGYFLNSRDFNSLIVDPVRGSVKKISTKIQKLADEAAWYQSLPQDMRILSPRILSFTQNLDSAEMEMEMYGYPALSELFVFGALNIEEWSLILRRLFDTHKIFEKYHGALGKDNFYDLYLHKTWQRLRDLQEQNPFWKILWQYKTIIINDKEYQNIRFFQAKLEEAIENLVRTCNVTLMHGDFCFSNILFDTNTFICRLIDPRGRLKEQTIYGDPRYDIAKLRHSVVGGYDFVVHGFCSLKEKRNKFVVANNYHRQQAYLDETFDRLTVEYGYEPAQIKLIEALLFASLIPLHKDSLERQKIFYLKAVKKLNDCLRECDDEKAENMH